MTGPTAAPRGPRVLVTAASKHGSTREIAAAVARWLPDITVGHGTGLTARFVPVDQHPHPAEFDAVMLGSAVYVGRWMQSARHYASTFAAVLRTRPVWLFSSGPIGEPPFPPEEPYDVQPIATMVGARGHRVFPGRLHPPLLTFEERAMATALRAPTGDFRDWNAVRAWCEEIATALPTASPAATRPAP